MTPEEMEREGEGILVRGTVVRYLLLPGKLSDAKKIVRYLSHTYGNQIYVSLMSQYTPLRQLPDHPELGRKVDKEEYRILVDYAMDQGIEQGFLQEGDVAEESFIPKFDGTGI